jgi:small-conductance mechanosensitive channel
MSWFDALWSKLEADTVALGERLPAAVLIIAAGWVLARMFSSAAYAVVLRHQQGQTLAPLLRNVVRGLVLATAAVMALDHLGVPIGTVLAGAGIIGLAVGFGAQALVKDVISGFFHIIQGVLSVGDVVQLGDVNGVVEEVGLRVTKVRAFNGQLWYLPNGSIDRVGNFNRGWSRAVVEVGVPHEQDVRRAMRVLAEVGEAFRREHPDVVLEPAEVDGALGLTASNVTVRLGIKVRAQRQWSAERELRLRVKDALAREGIAYHPQEQPAGGATPASRA